MDYGILNKLHIIIILAVKVNSSGILTCSLSGLIFISFFFWGSFFILFYILFSKSFDLSFKIFYPLFIFYYFQIWENNLHKARYLHIYKTNHSQLKNYEPYYYRTLTVDPQGDGISWWNAKNFETSSLWILTVMIL